jgi:hypothetical protein
MSLKNTRASGFDEITTKTLKLCAKSICGPLSHIINLSFTGGIFPEELKISIVKPLFKKGDKSDPNNYRPITIVPILSKIFEKAISHRFNEFFTKYDILTPKQFGFRKGKSTTLACFNLIKSISESINQKTPIMALFLDLSKAFDFVDHEIVLNKLYSYGIRGIANDWIESYLGKRTQCTEIEKLIQINYKNKSMVKEKFRSSYLVNGTGVPQGSILGPLLFLIAINDLPASIDQDCIIFADDTTLIIKSDIKDISVFERTINKTLSDTVSWLKRNNLQINIAKTKAMQFHNYKVNPVPLQIKYDNSPVETVDIVIFLGFNIDKNLNWKSHVDHVCKKLDRFVFALKRLRQTISVEAALTAYHGHVSSILGYGLLLWGNSVDIERAFKLQKKCVRALDKAWVLDSCKPLFNKFKILPLPCQYIRDACCMAKENQQYFTQRSETSNRHVRAQYMNLLDQPPCRSAIYKNNCYNMCILLYNKLPDIIKLENMTTFKTKLTKWLHEQCFYSIKEYLTRK